MSVERFKEDFVELRRRFTATECEKNPQSTITALTDQEIFEAVRDVLNLKPAKLDVTLGDSMRDDVRTPASGIVVTTPNAPDIQKVEHNGGMSGRYRSLDTLTAENLRDSPVDDLILPNPGPLTSKAEDDVDVITVVVPDGRTEDRKFMSKSSPAVSTLVRSDTFVREDEFESVKNGDIFDENKNLNPIAKNETGAEPTKTEMNLAEILKQLTAIRDSANDAMSKIDDIQNGGQPQKAVPENTRPIRRLSAMGCFPGLTRTSTAAKTGQRSKSTRRSMAAFPGTPTSSRLSPGATNGKDVDSLRRKSTSTLSLSNIGGTKLSIPSTYRSVSSGAIVVPKKSPNHASPAQQASHLSGIKAPKTPSVRSPALSLLSVQNKSGNRQTKNPKYAHVQSTIPKPGGTPGIRKAN